MTYIPSTKLDTITPEFFEDQQRIYNYVVDRIAEQGRPSVLSTPSVDGTMCVYTQVIDGKECHCAAGHILTPEMKALADEWDSKLAGGDNDLATSFERLVEEVYTSGNNPISSDTEELISALQSCHDTAARSEHFIGFFLIQAKGTADMYDLDHSCVDHWRSTLGTSTTVE